MKKIAITLVAIFGATTIIGCQGTNNSSTPSVPATSCITGYYNGVCSASTSTTVCNGQQVTYNPTTGTYTNMYGQQVSCTGVGGVGGVSTYGAGLGTGTGGCYYWDSVYPGNQYVPMIDPTSGQLECINVTSYGVSVPSNYNYSTPVYYAQPCSAQDPSAAYNPNCYGGYSPYGSYGSYGPYSGYSSGGTCIGAGGGDGSFFGLCF